MSTVLDIQNLVKDYGSIRAVNNLSFKVEKGQIFGLLGPNGSGKTTTLAIILSILNYNSGSYSWFNDEYGKKERDRIGAILETPNFYPYLDAVQNLDIIAHIKKTSDPRIDELLELVNLKDRKNSLFKTYSLGMKQRLAIAAALVGDPDVLIFDEPTNGLDPQGIAEVRNVILKVAGMGKTIIMSSHILAEIEKVCTHVGILKQGKLLASGTVGSIINSDLTIEVGGMNKAGILQCIQEMSFVKGYEDNGNYFSIQVNEDCNPEEVNSFLIKKGIVLNHLVARKKSLEAEFLEITGG